MSESLDELVYALIQLIPVGKVTTYGSIAKILNIHPRVVGRILARNREIIKIPCHRVVRFDGEIGGYSGGSVDFKAKLLKIEGVRIYVKNGKYYVDKKCIIDLYAKLLGSSRKS